MTEQAPPKIRIKQELLSLLERRPYKKITMKRLAESLDMTRQNLYKHYSSKDEIILDIIQERLDLVFDLLENMEVGSGSIDWHGLLRQSSQVLLIHKEMVCAVMTSDAEDLVFEYLKSFIARVLGHIARVNEVRIEDQDYFNLIVLHISGSGFNVVKGWAMNEMKTPAEQVVILFDDIVNESILEKLRLCDTGA
jgi:AcrR family transcriptional regulator